MKYKALLVCMAAFAVACVTTTAQAAKTVSKERQATMAKIAQNHRNLKQPRTVAEGARTQIVRANGSTQAAVPTELWNELSVREDAQGNVHVTEGEATSREELAHE